MPDVIIPINEFGNPLTPIESTSRVPLPIWAPVEGVTNRHHAHYYSRQFETGPRSLETRAVRFSRLQRVAKAPHRAMHDTFDGALLPETELDAFAITVLCVAGYVPSHVIDLTDQRNPRVVETTPAMRCELRSPGILTTESKRGRRAEIGQFLMFYAINQDFDPSEVEHIEQFLAIPDEVAQKDEIAARRRLRLGLRLTGKAIEAAVDPINAYYQQARSQDLLPLEAPVCAWLAVHQVVHGHEPDYLHTLAERLRARFGVTA